MPTVLVTGAGRGIGLELARQYAADGWRVIGTCRDMGRSADLRTAAPGAEILPLDVADGDSVAALGRTLAADSIDVLLCNAGMYVSRGHAIEGQDYAEWEETFRVNALGPIRVATALVEPVARGQGRRMVAISSRLGSIANCDIGRAVIYRSSKAALNMAWHCLALDLVPRGIVATAMHPGWVQTAMGGPNAPLTTTDSARAIRRTIAGLRPEDAGRFLDHDGTPIAW
ncbi:MAG: SDR family oxidoreductase [Alphaproteobacteria bacterium]